MSRITHNILTQSKASSFKFSTLNTNKIVFAAHNKPFDMSKRVK